MSAASDPSAAQAGVEAKTQDGSAKAGDPKSHLDGVSDEVLDLAFRNARSHHHWLPKPVSDEKLKEVYDLFKLGPTSRNSCPLRVIYVKSEAGKAKLLPAVQAKNQDQVRTAAVSAILAFDRNYKTTMDFLHPAMDHVAYFASKPEAEVVAAAERNAILQMAYFMLACRLKGLDTCFLVGYDHDAVDASFLKGTHLTSVFLLNIGYGDHSKLRARQPRLDFDQVFSIV